MPIPVLTDHFSAQVILKGLTGKPEDVYTNTFYFRNDTEVGTDEQFATDLATDLLEFYNAPPEGMAGPMSIASMLSGVTVSPEVEVRVYNLGLAAPRYPIIRDFTLTGMGTAVMPSEVAICLSYVAGQNQPRFRGRIFLGPLDTKVIVPTLGRAQVHANAQESILRSYARLMNKTGHQPVLWSPTDQATKEITGAWVDNAFDIQRRRGEEASSRMTIGIYQGRSGTTLDGV